MLTIAIPSSEFFDEASNKFIAIKPTTLQLEHSLVSLSKWESKWHKPFLDKRKKTEEETIDYIRCMTLTQNVDPNVYYGLSNKVLQEISAYIENPMTATWFSEDRNQGRPNREVITSELIYYWMIALQIPFECQKWHLNRLLTLIRVCNIKNTPGKKMSKSELMNRNAALNAARRKANNSAG